MKLLLLLPLFITSHLLGQDTLPARVYQLDQLQAIQDSSRHRVQIMDGPTSVLAGLEMHLTLLEPGKAAHPPHTHANQEELIIVKDGTLETTIAGKSKRLHAGGVALSLPGDEHGAVNTGTTNTAYYVIKYTTCTPVDIARGSAAGGSIMMNWDEPAVKKTDRGEQRSFFNRPTALFRKFDMHATTLNKGEVSHLPHTHREEEIILVISGSISMQLGDQHYPASEDDVVFIASGVPHALQNTGTGPCTYFAFQWQ